MIPDITTESCVWGVGDRNPCAARGAEGEVSAGVPQAGRPRRRRRPRRTLRHAVRRFAARARPHLLAARLSPRVSGVDCEEFEQFLLQNL